VSAPRETFLAVQTTPDHDGHSLEVSYPSDNGGVDMGTTGYDGMATVPLEERVAVAAAFLDVDPDWLADRVGDLPWMEAL
jgi:hypothetical protein